MISLKILELNRFMAKLLKTEAFDRFLLREGIVRTYMEYRFQGKLYTEYFDAAEQEQYAGRSYALWGEAKPFFLELIKGKRTPLAIRLHLILPEEETLQLLAGKHGMAQGSALAHEMVQGANYGPAQSTAQGASLGAEPPMLGLTLRYENGSARLFTGVSSAAFSLDGSLEEAWEAWDAGIKELLHQMEIAVEQE